MALKDRLKNVNISTTPKIVEETSFTEFIADALSQKVAAIPVWYDYDYSKQFELILNFLDNKLNSEFEDLSLSELEKKAIAEAFLKNNNAFLLTKSNSIFSSPLYIGMQPALNASKSFSVI